MTGWAFMKDGYDIFRTISILLRKEKIKDLDI